MRTHWCTRWNPCTFLSLDYRTDSGPARRLGSQLFGSWQHELHQWLPWQADRVHLGLTPEGHTANDLR